MSAKNPFNPFADVDFSKFDLSKMLGDLKMPGVDMDMLMTAQRKNIEAVTTANKVAIDGMQSVAKRQAEMLSETMATVSGAAQEIAGAGGPQEMTSKQAELTKQAFEKALGNMRELAEMVSKSNKEAFDVVNKRFKENIDELKSMLSSAAKPAKTK